MESLMFIATLRMTVQPKKMADAIAVLTTLCSQTEVLSGCQLCRLYRHSGMLNRDDEILLIERWDSKEKIEKHFSSPIFGQLLEIMDFTIDSPELMFYQVAQTSGFEMIEDFYRNKQNSDDFGFFR